MRRPAPRRCTPGTAVASSSTDLRGATDGQLDEGQMVGRMLVAPLRDATTESELF